MTFYETIKIWINETEEYIMEKDESRNVGEPITKDHGREEKAS